MKNLQFNKSELLEIIKKNRDAHRSIFEAAYEGFHQALLAELDQMKQAALNKKKVSLYIRLTEPVDMTDTYDKVIRMLEMSSDDVISLDEREFGQYILDEWNWKGQFIQANATYANSVSADIVSEAEMTKYIG